MRGVNRYGPSVVVLVAAIAVLFAGPMLVDRLQYAQEVATTQNARRELQASPLLTQLNNSFQSIARAVEPSVVHITVQRDGKGHLFGPSGLPSQGSGWVYDDRGHIVTNYHVIEGATRIEVRFSDGLPHSAVLVSGDESTDIAVLRVEGRRVVPISRATGTHVQQGDLVFAFGSPFGFEFSMSSGIVSGHGRQAHLSSHGYENYIQTDAAINPGNSGGPLTNIYGELVGMNMAIAVDPKDPVRSGRFTGVGLAIPLDMIEFVVEQLIAGVTIQRGGLGAELRDLGPNDEALINDLGLSESGVYVLSVFPGSPAAAAGLRVGDVILQAFGQSMSKTDTLRTMIHNLLPGSVVRLGIWRDRKLQTLDVVLGNWDTISARGALDDLGLSVEALTAQEASAAGLPTATGVRLSAVQPGSLAERVGLRAPIILLELDHQPVASMDDLIRFLAPLNRGEEVHAVFLGENGQRYSQTLALRPGG